MPRAKRGFKRKRRVNKVLDRAEGFHLRRKNTYRRAVETVKRALSYAYVGRKQRKRDFRSLWITRLSAAANQNEMSYSRLISALNQGQVGLNRKMLSEIAIHDPSGFKAIVDEVRTLAPTH